MDKFTFSIWYKGYKNISEMYDILEKYAFFRPNEIYVDETNDSPYYRRKMNENEIKRHFQDVCNDGVEHCITICGKAFLLVISPTINVGDYFMISFDISPSILKYEYECFENLFKEILDITDAFYGFIDSIDNSGEIFENEKEETYKPDEYVQAIFWGNYFGGDYANNDLVLKIVESEHCVSEQIANGWFVKLSDSVCEYSLDEVVKKRKKLRKYIKTLTGYHRIRL